MPRKKKSETESEEQVEPVQKQKKIVCPTCGQTVKPLTEAQRERLEAKRDEAAERLERDNELKEELKE